MVIAIQLPGGPNLLRAPATNDRRVRIGIRHQVDQLKEQRELVIDQLRAPNPTDAGRLVAHIASFDARIAMIVDAARPRKPESAAGVG